MKSVHPVKMILGMLIILLTSRQSNAQTLRNARCVALAGAYGSLARGLFAVEYNPANLALPDAYKTYRLWTGVSTRFANNFLSIASYNKYNGKNWEANNGELKQEFLAAIPDRGWRLFSDFDLALPYINISRANRAFTANIMFIGDLGLPRGVVYFVFDGNPIGKRLNLDIAEELLMVGQWAYSFAIPTEHFSVGFTLKYLQGLGYLGINPDSSYGFLNTRFGMDRNYIIGEGHYLFQQSLGGRGFGLNIGITTKEFNGYRFGASLINALGHIYFGQSTLLTRAVPEDEVLPWDGKFYRYDFAVDKARFDKFFGGAEFEDLFSGQGEILSDTTNFRVRYPALVRFSMSKWITGDAVLATDFVAGFEDRLYSFGAWKWSIGIESIYFPNWPLRIGMSFGGRNHQELAFGSGWHKGFMHLDWALGINQGLWFKHAKGFNFSVTLYTTRRWKE